MAQKTPAEETLTAERRNSRRYPLQLEVDLRTHQEGSVAVASGQTRDISVRGFYFSGLPESLQEGARVELAIRLPGPTEGRRVEVRGVGRVVRVDLGSDNKIGVAVKFDRIDLSAEELESIT